MPGEHDRDPRKPVDLEHSTKSVFTEPADVFGMDLAVPTPAIDKIAAIEDVRRRQHKSAAVIPQMSTSTSEKVMHVVEVIDDLACEDGVEAAAEVEVLSISRSHVEAVGA